MVLGKAIQKFLAAKRARSVYMDKLNADIRLVQSQ